jgi:hypothetical protein
MMNKSIYKSILALIIILLLILVLFRNRSPFGRSNSSFAIGQEKEITKLELSSGGKKLILEKKGEVWLINNKYEARKSGILFITRILKEIKIKSTVSADLFRSEISDKKVMPVRVRAYENRKLVGSFQVYKTRSNGYGNIMKIRESSKPFIIYIPGYEGDIGSAFIVNELFWQNYTIFNLLPSEIGSVSFVNFSDPEQSFEIINRDKELKMTGPGGELSGWDPALVRRYLSYFARVPFESWCFDIDDTLRNRIITSQPAFKIRVTTITGKKMELSLWQKMTGDQGNEKTDLDRLYGKTDEHDELFIMRYFDIDPLIKKRSYFFP